MPIFACSELPNYYLNFHSHDYQGAYINKSLVPFSISYPGAYINKTCKFNAKRKALWATKASNDSHPETPAPATKPSSSWKQWLAGILLSIILPSFRHNHKWAPLLALKSKVDMTLETVESVAEVVEEVAEGVEKVADEIANKIPDDTKLREAMELIENQAREAVKKADLVEDLVNKIQEAEKMLENEFTEPNTDQEKIDQPKQSSH